MPKSSPQFVDVTKPIPEWGLSDSISTAVPISVSGAEVKSTRDISNGMQNIVRDRVKHQLKRLIVAAKKEKHSGAVFTVRRHARSGVFVSRKAK